MKKQSKILHLKKLTVSKLNSLTISGGTDPHFTYGCPPSHIICPTLIPHICYQQTEKDNCTQECLSDIPECYTDMLCDSVDVCL